MLLFNEDISGNLQIVNDNIKKCTYLFMANVTTFGQCNNFWQMRVTIFVLRSSFYKSKMLPFNWSRQAISPSSVRGTTTVMFSAAHVTLACLPKDEIHIKLVTILNTDSMVLSYDQIFSPIFPAKMNLFYQSLIINQFTVDFLLVFICSYPVCYPRIGMSGYLYLLF